MEISLDKEEPYRDHVIRRMRILYGSRNSIPFFGVDPGTKNLGIAIIYERHTDLFQITLKRDRDAVKRINEIEQIMPYMLDFEFTLFNKAVIEGASFGDRYRQVELAEQRAAFVSFLNRKCKLTSILSPLTIRKQAFGSAKIMAKDVYPFLPKDAAVAFSCALVAMNIDKTS